MGAINTPDQRLRVFVSSTLGELADERVAAREAVERLRLTPVLFELGARPHPPRELYRAYLEQSDVFLGIYWQRYGWVAPGETRSGLEDEYRLAAGRPRLLYVKRPAPDREPRLGELLAGIAADGAASYKYFTTPEELGTLVENDLALLLTERFQSEPTGAAREGLPSAPVPASTTVGRDAEVAQILELVDRGARLVSLTGPGGIGKTRMAVEVSRQLVSRGVATGFVSLVDDTTADRALRHVAEEVGAHPEGRVDVIGSLAERLAVDDTVLVLDNVEQIDGIGEALAHLLERTPRLRVLATSRHAMRIGAEREVRVPPLGLPAAGAGPADVRAAPAVQMFLDRLQAVAPDVHPHEADLVTIAEICCLLDASPLAIELAAARARVLSLADLRARVDERFDALGIGGSDRPERQRTLRATIEWSYRLLVADERRLLADLSVFAGGWTLEAATAVATPEGGNIVDTLASLLDKSLVTVERGPSGEPRFSMLGSVRAFARERLAAREDVDGVRRRHLAEMRRFGQAAQPFLCGPGQREWLTRVDPERANLREAVGFARLTADDEAVVELAWDVVVYYFVKDGVDEPDDWLRAVRDAGRRLPTILDARHRTLLAVTRIHRGDLTGAGSALRTSLAVFRDEGMHFEAAVALHQLGFVMLDSEADPAGAIEALGESSSLFAAVGHDWGVSLAEAMLGSVLMEVGDLAGAEGHLTTSLARASAIECEPQEVQARTQLALLRVLQDRPDAAVDALLDALPPMRAGRFLTDATYALDLLAAVALSRDLRGLAGVAAATGRETRRRLGVSPWPAMRSLIDRTRSRLTATLPPGEGDAFETLERVLAEVRR